MNLAEQIIAQKEALIKRAVANELDSEAPGLLDLQGRLSCVSFPESDAGRACELWSLDNKHILTTYAPRYIKMPGGYRAIVDGVVHNEPEPESLPESGEIVNYIGPEGL